MSCILLPYVKFIGPFEYTLIIICCTSDPSCYEKDGIVSQPLTTTSSIAK